MAVDNVTGPSKKTSRNNLLLIFIFLLLIIITGVLGLTLKKKTVVTTTIQPTPQTNRTTKELYNGINLDRDQRGLMRGRFVKIDGNTIYLETAFRYEKNASTEALEFSDKTVFECEDRYYKTSDGVKIDKLNALTYTENYNGEFVTGGLGINWFNKNVVEGEAVEVRFLGDGSSRIPTQIVLYKDDCNKFK